MNAKITVVRPDLEEAIAAPTSIATRRPVGNGARLLLIDNGKPKARDLLQMIAEELGHLVPLRSVETISKSTAVFPITAEVAHDIAERADLVIAGLGDCGACSACSLHDAIQMENLGIPSTVVISDAFVGHIAKFASNLGMPNYHSLVVPHPVASRDEAHLRRLAVGVAAPARDQLFETAKVFAEAT
ncbi:MAG TPA: UGSC family (seleno)protein [Bauldia sp.]|nr:UGSC family (seleno)protein [Bauldia sp.]